MKKYWTIQGQDGLWWGLKRYPDGTNGLMDTNGMHWAWPGNVAIRPASFEEIHSRPKPPEIYGGQGRAEYELDNPKVVTVYLSRGGGVWRIIQNLGEIENFPTHAEAIAYAQKHAHESGGEVSGA